MAGDKPTSPEGRRIFRFADAEYDEATGQLMVAGDRCDLEAKPLAVLLALLLRPGVALSKQELMQIVWPNAAHISSSSLATAISKLRSSFGKNGRDIIEVIYGIGYKFTAPVEITIGQPPSRFAFTLLAGDHVHLRPGWILQRKLSASARKSIWVATHGERQAKRVFTFVDSKQELLALKQELRVFRELSGRLGQRDDLLPFISWNLDTAPYFLEAEYGGASLAHWAADHGGVTDIGLDQRIAMLASLASTLAAAHSVGITHGRLDPSKILFDFESQVSARPRVIGFVGSHPRHAAITAVVEPTGDSERGSKVCELHYLAPELLLGAPATPAADVYVLGVLLYQLLVGDLQRPLTAGWEADVQDPILRQDIAAAITRDPAQRQLSAATLAERLDNLVERRAVFARDLHELECARALRVRLEQERLRRPWIFGIAVSLVIGIISSSIFAIIASESRDTADRRSHQLQAVNIFLTQDLLGQGDPAISGTSNESLMDAVKAAEASIALRLAGDPDVAGAIYLALAKVYESRSAYDNARRAFDSADHSFAKAGQSGDSSRIIAKLLRAEMEVESGQPGSLTIAKSILVDTRPQIENMQSQRKQAEVERDAVTGMIEMWGGDVYAAHTAFKQAADGAATLPETYDPTKQLSLRRQEAFTYARLGNWQVAESMLSEILAKELVVNGLRHPDTLHVKLNLAEIRLARGEAQMALDDADRIFSMVNVVLGPYHFLTLQALTLRAEALASLQRYDEAATAWMILSQTASVALGPRNAITLEPLSAAAKQLCRAGKLEIGLSTGKKALAEAQIAFGEANPLTQEMAGNVAFCLILLGNAQEAMSLVNHIDPSAVADLTMDPNYPNKIDIMRVAIARENGDRQFGNDLLRQASLAFRAQGADVFMRDWAEKLSSQTTH